MTHQDFVTKFLKGLGAEIGAFESPVPGIKPIYIDKFKEFAGVPCKADYYGEAINLPFLDESLDYIVASHVLEHSANPIAALGEWYRALKPGGIAYVIVPDKRYTWDRERPDTTLEHMIEDYQNGVTDCDPTHIDDFAFGIDWAEFAAITEENLIEAQRRHYADSCKEQVARGEDINIHFHVFTPGNFKSLIADASRMESIPYDWEIKGFEEQFPAEHKNGILAILEKRAKKEWRHAVPNVVHKLFHRSYPLTSTAISFEKHWKTANNNQ